MTPRNNAKPSLCCLLGLIVSAASARAALLTATNCQAQGANWTAAIWKTNGTGAAMGPPVSGNAYAIVNNGIAVANNVSNARVRNPLTASVQSYPFPGDVLTVATNAEFRFKIANSTSTTVSFPGVGGNPGLVADGGFLNIADASAVMTAA